MELWLVVVITIGLAALIKPLLGFFSSGPKLPPSPPTISLIGNILWRITSFSELLPFLRSLHAKYGPILTLRIGSHPAILISKRSLIHQVLVQNATTFAYSPSIPLTLKLPGITNISTSDSPKWRALRRNLVGEILHPANIRSYSSARSWALSILLDRIKAAGRPTKAVQMMDHFRYVMFCLQMRLCFGVRFEELQVMEVVAAQLRFLLSVKGLGIILNFWPKVGKVLFSRRWKKFREAARNLENVVIPLIRARSEARAMFRNEKINVDDGTNDDEHVMCYVDTLLDLELPPEEGKRKLTEAEMVDLCSEFLNAGSDTTSTGLQRIMANIVKHPEVQDNLYNEIRAVINPEAVTVEKDDLQKLPYLKAVVLEALRRHPPGNFLLPRTATEDTKLGGYLIPKNASVSFMVAEMGLDPAMWEDPMAFRPDRFLRNGNGNSVGVDGFDITGTREIKMMPFGAGRRICPGYGLAVRHLEYFTANLVWAFEWKVGEGHDVDLSETQIFVTRVMKNPLRAIVIPRLK